MEIFFKDYTKAYNKQIDEQIERYKAEKVSCFIRRKNTAGENESVEVERFECTFFLKAWKKRYENKEYQNYSYEIQELRSSKIDSVARLSELGYAIIRSLPLLGSYYSLYVYKTSTVYIPLIHIHCGSDN